MRVDAKYVKRPTPSLPVTLISPLNLWSEHRNMTMKEAAYYPHLWELQVKQQSYQASACSIPSLTDNLSQHPYPLQLLLEFTVHPILLLLK
jgi:hypothetical protein